MYFIPLMVWNDRIYPWAAEMMRKCCM